MLTAVSVFVKQGMEGGAGMSGKGPQLGAGKGVGVIASDVSAKNPLSVGRRTPKTPRPPEPLVEDRGASYRPGDTVCSSQMRGCEGPLRATSLIPGQIVSFHPPSKIPEISAIRC